MNFDRRGAQARGAGWMLLLLAMAGCSEPTPPRPAQGLDVRWLTPAVGSRMTAAVDDSLAFFAANDHEILAVRRQDGTVRWRARASSSTSATDGWTSRRVGSVVVVPDGALYGFDARTGTLRWTAAGTHQDIIGFDYIDGNESLVVAPSTAGWVYGLDAETGALRWEAPVDTSQGARAFAPLLAGNSVFACAVGSALPRRGTLAALDRSTGQTRWRRSLAPELAPQGAGCYGAVAVANDRVMVSVEDGTIRAFSVATGDSLWVAPRVHQLPPAGPYNDLRPIGMVGGRLIVGSSTDAVVGLDPVSGREVWRAHGVGSTIRTIAEHGGLAILYHGGSVTAVDPANGAVRFSSAKPGTVTGASAVFEITAPPLAAGDALYAPTTAGFVRLHLR